MTLRTIQNNRLVDGSKLTNLPDVQTPVVGAFLSGDGSWIAPEGGGDMLAALNLTDVADQQTALDNLTAVSAATDEFVLTKDTATGNAIWKVGGSGTTTYDALTDTSASKVGQALKGVRVNALETALEYYVITAGGDALVANPLSQFAATTSAQLAGVMSDETGSGALVFGTSPTLTNPTVTGSLTMTSGNIEFSGTDTSLGRISAGILAIEGKHILTTDSTATLTNKTIDANGTGNSISNIAVADLANGTDGELITWDAAGAPAVVATGTATHVLTSNGAGAAPTFQAQAGGGDALTANPLSQFAATTSAQLAGVISDETGSGLLVFGTSPTLVTPALGTPSALVGTNITGTAAGLTAGAVSTITGLAPDTATTQATQAGITTCANLTTVGTIATGTWNGDTIAIANGGTGATSLAAASIPTYTSTNTFTNKRVTLRAPAVTQAAAPAINTDITDVAHITGLAQAITSMTTNLTGTPVEGDQLRIDITGTAARAITWGASFEAGAVSLPTITVTTTRLDVAFFWNTATSKWRCMASG